MKENLITLIRSKKAKKNQKNPLFRGFRFVTKNFDLYRGKKKGLCSGEHNQVNF
jgi:hypothetical protein